MGFLLMSIKNDSNLFNEDSKVIMESLIAMHNTLKDKDD